MSSSASWLPSFLDPTTASEVLAYTTAAAATQLGQLTKTRQKIRLKNSGNSRIMLMPAPISQNFEYELACASRKS